VATASAFGVKGTNFVGGGNGIFNKASSLGVSL
jgi:hypothetical protein